MPFQINTKKLFLTYPQCPLTKDVALTAIRQRLPQLIEHYIVAHELHANGDHHLHMYLELFEPFRTRDSQALDIVEPLTGVTYHGNYQGCRSAKNVIKYCTKAEDYLSDLDVATLLSGKSVNRALLGRKLIDGELSLTQAVDENPSLLFGYQRLKLDLATYLEDAKIDKPDLPTWLPNPWGKILPSFPNRKKRHYWIYSRQPNKGKTYHFARPLLEEYRGVVATGDFSSWSVDKNTQLLVLDEYNTARLRYDQLNAMCDGQFNFKVLYRGVIIPKKYLVIVLSNQPLSELYPFMNELLYSRFNEIEL